MPFGKKVNTTPSFCSGCSQQWSVFNNEWTWFFCHLHPPRLKRSTEALAVLASVFLKHFCFFTRETGLSLSRKKKLKVWLKESISLLNWCCEHVTLGNNCSPLILGSKKKIIVRLSVHMDHFQYKHVFASSCISNSMWLLFPMDVFTV